MKKKKLTVKPGRDGKAKIDNIVEAIDWDLLWETCMVQGSSNVVDPEKDYETNKGECDQ